MSQTKSTHSPQIIVIDDDHEMLATVCEFLQESGYRVLGFSRAGSALQQLQAKDFSNQVAGIVTDLSMPGMNGMDFLTSVKSVAPQIPVIIMTAHADVANAAQASRLGAFAMLAKPFSMRSLIDLLKQACKCA